MDSARLVRYARRKAHLSQRALSRRTGIAQPAIARIESGRVVPRVDTLQRLLEGCGQSLELAPRRGTGIDRTVIRELLALSPAERLRIAVEEANNLQELLERASRR